MGRVGGGEECVKLLVCGEGEGEEYSVKCLCVGGGWGGENTQ